MRNDSRDNKCLSKGSLPMPSGSIFTFHSKAAILDDLVFRGSREYMLIWRQAWHLQEKEYIIKGDGVDLEEGRGVFRESILSRAITSELMPLYQG
jgi:hypothetical protein